ncbi:hypothetical protein [Phaeobacter sp.]|uniref:hypothetical protein n=1 Tax=Phaeobacter sp. TaxID=1902409 RepID=UPI0025E8AD04|nr:hypothetical protein [Phaeobacter sp.]
MSIAQQYLGMARRAVATLALLGLAGCALQDEAATRASLADWVQLGETEYFFSRRNCAAGVFEIKATRISSRLAKARSVRAGLRHLDNGRPVAFEVAGLSPDTVSLQVVNSDEARGKDIVRAGIVGKDCMLDPVSDVYLKALVDQSSVLIYDPVTPFLAVVDRSNRRVFYARSGNVW